MIKFGKWTYVALLSITAVMQQVTALTAEVVETTRIAYPQTERTDQVDDYHGTTVADPYRWLEQDIRESTAVREWAEQQNEITRTYLDQLPERAPIHARLTQLWNHERYSAPAQIAGKYFFSKNDGLQNQS
ncbi:MAG: hypothetical protein KDA99_23775, partial [Planctomycetales bacterium]|nr:hypothetical protein [Planctomycetales bacterium]